MKSLYQPDEIDDRCCAEVSHPRGSCWRSCDFCLNSSWKGNNNYCLWVQFTAFVVDFYCFTAVCFGYVLKEGLMFSVKHRRKIQVGQG